MTTSVSVAVLSPGFSSGPLVPSSPTTATSVIQFTPVNSGSSTCTTNCTVEGTPVAATGPT